MSNRRDFTNKNTKFTGVLGIEIPAGSSAERGGSPALGTLRYNSDTGLAEFYTPTGWAGVDAPPVVSNVTGTINENTNSTITITGTGFKNGALVIIAGAGVSGVERTLTTTFVNSTSLTAATNATAVNYVGGASFNVKVLNPSGLTGELVAAGAIDRDPVFSTAAGSLGSYAGPATGGTVTEYSRSGTTYRVHTFYDSGTFTLNTTTNCDIMLVGGGGGGHGGFQSPAGGGGGAGGLVYYKARSMSSGSYTVTVGAQGNGGFGDTNGGAYVAPTAGGNTSFTGLTTAVGGGRGGGYESTPSTTGGSGGGGNNWGDGGAVNRSGTTNQGNSGGAASTDTAGQNSGGGGGAGGAGENGQGNGGRGGVGGNGVLEGTSTVYNFQTGSTTTFQINGSGEVYCAGGASGIGYNADNATSFQRVNGGNAGSNTLQTGGTGGQNFESNLAGGMAKPYTGSGGGGAGGVIGGNTNAFGGNGSKGLVVVSYPLPTNYANFSLTATDPDGSAIASYALASGSLPSGMTLNSNGTITGNPTTLPASNTTYSFTATATGADGQVSASRSFSFIVPTRTADPGPGGGFSIAQGADATEALGVTTTSQTKYQTRVNDQGGTTDSFSYQNGTFGFHTGHNSLWWPSFTAIQVSSATYGRVLNQMQWYKHANACGNFDIYGSNQSITSGNYTDLSLWTHLGRNFSGGPGSGDEQGLMTFGFNPNNYGYRWYLIHIADAAYVKLPYPMVGNRAGWANYGCRLNCINPGGDGSSSVNAAVSGVAIRNQGLPTGYYWIKPYGETARYCYVDNTNYGGGWVLVQTVGSGTNSHFTQTGDFNLYNDGVKSYVPFSGTGYSTTDGRRYADSFVNAIGHGAGGEGVFRLEIARNGASPVSNNTLTNSTDYKCAQFLRMDKNQKWYSSATTGASGDVTQRSFDIAHYYPYDARWEHGQYNNNTGSNASGHFRPADANYKVFDGHSNPSSISTSLYSDVRFLWGYTGGSSGTGIYGGGVYSFNTNAASNPGYMWIR